MRQTDRPGHLGFYQNFVLLATFLDMGVGLMRARSSGTLRWLAAPALLAMIGSICYVRRAAIAAPVTPDEYVWAIFTDREGAHRIPLLQVVATLFALTEFFFIPLGALLGLCRVGKSLLSSGIM